MRLKNVACEMAAILFQEMMHFHETETLLSDAINLEDNETIIRRLVSKKSKQWLVLMSLIDIDRVESCLFWPRTYIHDRYI